MDHTPAKYGVLPIYLQLFLFYKCLMERTPVDPVRTLLVQKNKALSSHLADFLAEAGISQITCASSHTELMEKADRWSPHLILLDIYVAGDELPKILSALKRRGPQVKVVLTGPEPELYYASHAAAMGADLYLPDCLEPGEWIRRLEALTNQLAQVFQFTK